MDREQHVDKERLPLNGLTVLDFTRLLPGPLATMHLGAYGADIVKIEDVETGDPTRFVGRFINGSGAFFRQLNRNKKSIALNLKTEEGREIVKKLVVKADVLVEGFRPGVMKKLGLGYEELSKINRRMVYAAITGYGYNNTFSYRAGHDINYSGLSGLLSLCATRGEKPEAQGIQVADIAAGSLMAINAVMMALYARGKSGDGSFVDVSLTRGLLPFLSLAAAGINSDEDIARKGSGPITGAYACYNTYETKDGKYMSLGALEPIFWQRFCEKIKRPEWIELQFDQEKRLTLINQLEIIFREKSREEWVEELKDIDACCEPVLEVPEAIDHLLSKETCSWLEMWHGDAKEVLIGYPYLVSGNAGAELLPPPGHGEHTREILKNIGYSKNGIDELAAKMIIKVNRNTF